MGKHFHGIPEMNSLGVLVGIPAEGAEVQHRDVELGKSLCGKAVQLPQPGMLRAKTSISGAGPWKPQ